jgi:hypothetical protein
VSRLPKSECVIKVGDGRGFILQHHPRRIIVTAAHCLPHLPPAHAAASWHERTYGKLLGPLEGSGNKICTECMFVDPVADIAVLGTPETQELYEEADAYDELIDNAPALRLSSNLTNQGWVLKLDRQWVQIPLHVFSGPYGMSLSIGFTKAGMSGSPILNDAGRAVGVISVGADAPQPILCRNLPGWCLRNMKRKNRGV